jgi:N2227-like protein
MRTLPTTLVILNHGLQAKNFIDYLRVIHHILAPGGVWINLGPLLWHWENSDEMSIELTLDEVKKLARSVGFELSVCYPPLPWRSISLTSFTG